MSLYVTFFMNLLITKKTSLPTARRFLYFIMFSRSMSRKKKILPRTTTKYVQKIRALRGKIS